MGLGLRLLATFVALSESKLGDLWVTFVEPQPKGDKLSTKHRALGKKDEAGKKRGDKRAKRVELPTVEVDPFKPCGLVLFF